MTTADYWQPVPLGWRDAPAVSALAVRIKKRDPRLLLLDLWDWAHCFGWTHPVAFAPEAIEKGAGWHGRRGVLYAALVETGWVRESEGVAVICRWRDDGMIVGRPTTRKTVKQEITEIAEQQREQARIRQRRSRAKRRDNDTSRPVTECDDRDSHSLSRVTTVTSVQNPLVLQMSVTAQEQEQEQEKEQTKNLALFAPAASAATGGKPKRAKAKAEGEEPNCTEDRERWLAKVRELTGLTESELIPSKASSIRFAQQRKLRGMEQLMRALEGLQNDPFAKTAGLGYLLSDDGITKGLAKWKKEAGTIHISRQYGEIDPELGF